MPEIIIDLDPDLHARMTQWAREQQRPLPALTRDILAAAERVRASARAMRWRIECSMITSSI